MPEEGLMFTCSDDVIYYQPSSASLRYQFLEVSDFFDTPSEEISGMLRDVTDFLNRQYGE